MNTWLIITYLIATISWLVLMIISSNKARREIFPWIIAIPIAPIVVTVGGMFIGFALIGIVLFEVIPNYLFKDK